MFRSKSRLKSRLESQTRTKADDLKNNQQVLKIGKLMRSYLRHIHLIIIGLILVFLIRHILTNTYPSDPLYHLGPIKYWPLALLTFLSSFFILTFITLNTLRGIMLSSTATWLLIYKLNGVEITFQIVIIAIIATVITENIIVFFKKIS